MSPRKASGRRAPSRVDKNSSFMDGVSQYLGNVNDLKAGYEKYQRYFDAFGVAITKSSKRINTKIAKDTAESIDSITDHLAKTTSKQVRDIEKSLGHMNELAKKYKRTLNDALPTNVMKFYGKRFEDFKQLKKPETSKKSEMFSEMKAIFKENFAADAIAQKMVYQRASMPEALTDALMESLKESMLKLVQQLPKILLVAGAVMSIFEVIKKIVERVSILDSLTTTMSKEFGGRRTEMLKFVMSLEDVVQATNYSKEEIMEFAMALKDAGVPLLKNKEITNGMLTSMINLARVTGIGAEQVAEFAKHATHAGESGKGLWEQFTGLYRLMTEFQLSTQEFNSSLSEGASLWGQIGSIGNRSLSAIQSSALSVKGIFRLFNLDLKETGQFLGNLDMTALTKRAGFITMLRGGDFRKRFADMALKPEAALEETFKATIASMQNFSKMGARFDLSADEIRNRPDSTSILYLQKAALANTAQGLGITEDIVSQIMSDFQAFKAQNSGAGVDQWYQARREALKGMATPEAGLEGAVKSINNTLNETLKRLENWINGIFDNVAYFIAEALPKMFEFFNGIISVVISIGKRMGVALGDFANFSGLVLKDLSQWKAEQNKNTTPGLTGFLKSVFGGGNTPSNSNFSLGGSRVTVPSHHGPAFDTRVAEIAKKYGMSPDDLMTIMRFESGVDPSRMNSRSGAVGLIQFTNTKKKFGLSKEHMANMSAMKQLDYVDEYFRRVGHKDLKTLQDAYLAVFSPAFIGKDPNFKMYGSHEQGYKQNANLDLKYGNKDGFLQVWEATKAVQSAIPKSQRKTVAAQKTLTPPFFTPPPISAGRTTALLEQQNTLLKEQNQHLKTIADGTAEGNKQREKTNQTLEKGGRGGGVIADIKAAELKARQEAIHRNQF